MAKLAADEAANASDEVERTRVAAKQLNEEKDPKVFQELKRSPHPLESSGPHNLQRHTLARGLPCDRREARNLQPGRPNISVGWLRRGFV